MSKKKACKTDKLLYEGSECPLCKGSAHVTNWKGRIHFIDPSKSKIAKAINCDKEGEYAIKVS